ncbi:hypothetical protein [Bacillus sp. MUM 13]|uniref:hypothetical protein n=1 Tax=Bacillus sp. MUM 13 TaxID=1678001 RepID=UPI0008F5AFCC|nr:hypothetical protein [Bacillus sp. MUM 13]OIK11375.1 hypothetical protein BIV59_11945 [Bacillus sp. MUM 13]
MRIGIAEVEHCIASNHKDTYKQFYLEYEVLLFKTAFSLTQNSSMAEQLLLSVFRDLWEKPEMLKKTQEKFLSVFLLKLTMQNYQTKFLKQLN